MRLYPLPLGNSDCTALLAALDWSMFAVMCVSAVSERPQQLLGYADAQQAVTVALSTGKALLSAQQIAFTWASVSSVLGYLRHGGDTQHPVARWSSFELERLSDLFAVLDAAYRALPTLEEKHARAD